ncbi:MAG TPA: hypothetical protein VN137_06365 [Sphingomonas sp.]|nr:hypothetical protein [Sphingomonas sp.]
MALLEISPSPPAIFATKQPDMSHHINALIGKRSVLAGLIDRLGIPAPTDLPFDLVIIPLDEGRLDALALSSAPAYDGFTYLTPDIVSVIALALDGGAALYIETDYFGGIGGQAAGLVQNGSLVWSAVSSNENSVSLPDKTPISAGLAKLGVIAEAGRDEFDEVGLVRFRSLDALGLDD